MADCERVLHVLHSMNCGGAENLIMNLYRNIDRRKIQFDFLVHFDGGMYFQDEIERFGGRIYRMKTLLRCTPPVYASRLERFFRQHSEYKIVHSHLETTTGIILECAKKAGVPVRIAHAHNTRNTRKGLFFLPENLYKNYLGKKIVPAATGLFACSEPAAKWLYRDKSSQAVIFKNGIDIDRFRFSPAVRVQTAEALCIPKSTTVLMHTGRFYDQKNHRFLIEIFEAYQKINPDSLLLLIGEGPLREDIEKRVLARGLLHSVRFLGTRDDVDALLQRGDIFLLPSKFEGLPLALVEAQCAGLNCYVSDCVPRESDLGCELVTFLPLDSPAEWAESMLKTPAVRASAGEKVAAAGYDIKRAAKRLEDIYAQMLYEAR